MHSLTHTHNSTLNSSNPNLSKQATRAYVQPVIWRQQRASGAVALANIRGVGGRRND